MVYSDATLYVGTGPEGETVVLPSREGLVQGMPTASSLMAEGTQGIPYVQAAHVELLVPGQPLPDLGATKELEGALHPYAPGPLRQRKQK